MGEANEEGKVLLEVKNLEVNFTGSSGLLLDREDVIKAVNDVSFKVHRGKTIGLVGESGSGKTTIGRSIVRLTPITSGKIYYDGLELTSLSEEDFFPYRKKIQMIFQDPFNSLNPRMTLFEILAEPLEIHFPQLNKKEKRTRVAELLVMVNLDPGFMNRYPHELSGGQRQRIGIARALAVEPEFIICDEPVSALDVSVQAQIVNLLQDLQEELELTYLFIAHDLAVIEHISDEVCVMNSGQIVEQASAESIYKDPKHSYTKQLLEAIPEI